MLNYIDPYTIVFIASSRTGSWIARETSIAGCFQGLYVLKAFGYDMDGNITLSPRMKTTLRSNDTLVDTPF